MTKIKFRNGYASTFGGGAILLDGGSLTASSCTFTTNKAINGGGGAIETDCKLTVSKSTFTNNQAGNYGGAIFSGDYGGPKSSIISCTFKNNQVAKGSSGVISSDRNKCTVSKSTFTNNKAKGWGGAISSVKTVTDSTFKNNQAVYGGGAIETVKTVKGSTFTNNKVTKTMNKAGGGAIYTVQMTVL